MARKLSLLIATVAVIAGCVVPAAAQAAPEITKAPGVRAAVGEEVVATSAFGHIDLTSSTLGKITCEEVVMNAKLTKNNGMEFEGEDVFPGFALGCTNGGNVVGVGEFTLSKIKSVVTGSGTLNFTVAAKIGAANCKWTGTNVAFTYGFGGASILFEKAGGIAGAPAACGTAKLDGLFLLSIGGNLVILD